MLLSCSCKSFLTVQLNCWRSKKKFNNQPELKISSIVYLCISMLIYHDLHCLPPPSPNLQKNKKSPRSSASSPFHHPLPPTRTSSAALPQLRPPRQLSLPVTKIRAPKLPSKNFDRCLFGFPLKLFPALFQLQVPKP